MGPPTLGRATTSFQAWKSQVEAFFTLKDVADDSVKLKLLPACLEEEVLIRAQAFLGLGTTTFSTAQERLHSVWLQLRRPLNPEKMFAELSFSQPSEAADICTQLKWLAEYLAYDEKIIKKRFITASPNHLQPLLLSKSSEKLDSLVEFVLQCSDSPTTVAFATSTDKRAVMSRSDRQKNRDRKLCEYCHRSNHSIENCRRRLGLCLLCGSSDHRVAGCPRRLDNQKNEL